MSYLLLIIEPPGQRATRTEAEGRAAHAAMQAFAQGLEAQGRLRAAQSLGGHGQGQRFSRARGEPGWRDGPFAEAKEMVGGFFWLQNVDRAQAQAIAQACPAADWCTVELRPLAPCHDESRASAI